MSQRHEKCCDARSDREWSTAATLVTAGALLAIADKHINAVERDEVVYYVKERMPSPGLTGPRSVNLFDECAQRLQEPDFLDVTIDAFRHVSGMSLSSDAVEIAERVAAADGPGHLHEQRAVRLIRQLAKLSEAEGVVSLSDCYELTRTREYLRRGLGVR